MEENTNENARQSRALRAVKFLNVLCMTVLFGVIWYVLLSHRIFEPFFRRGNWVMVFLYFILYYLFGKTYEAFLISYSRISEMFYSQMLALFMTDFLMILITFLLARQFYNPLPYILLYAIQALTSITWCRGAHTWYFRHYPAKKTIIVWDMRKGLKKLIDEKGLDIKFNVIADYQVTDCVENLSVLDPSDCVFIIGVHSHDRNKIIKYCVANDKMTFVIPRIGDVLMSSAKKVHLFHLPMLRLQRYNPAPEYLFIKRAFDIVVSLVGLVVLSPVYLIFSILIKKEDGGPVLYKQVRLTKDGKKFNVLKFRSMRVDAEKDGVARLSSGENDDRITPIGKTMRAHRIDELPQLVNILRGDMSIVGPRPERPEIAAQYEEELPEFKLRLQCKCGLTGYAQVYGKYNTTPYDKLQMDLMYIANPSIAQDLSIIFATVKILFVKDSTEGIEEGQTTAAGSTTQEETDRVKKGKLNQDSSETV